MRTVPIVVGGVAAVNGGIAPSADELVVAGKAGIVGGVPGITNANVVAGAEWIGVVVAVPTDVSKGRIERVDAGVDDADDDAFALGAG